MKTLRTSSWRKTSLIVVLSLAVLALAVGAASAQTRSLYVEGPATTGKPAPRHDGRARPGPHDILAVLVTSLHGPRPGHVRLR